jgi:hypothetical protein
MTISRWIGLRMGNVVDKICRENQNTPFMFSIFFFYEHRDIMIYCWKMCWRQTRLKLHWNMAYARCTLAKQGYKRASSLTHTHTQYLFLFHGNSGWENTPQVYVTRTFPVLLTPKRNTSELLLHNSHLRYVHIYFLSIRKLRRFSEPWRTNSFCICSFSSFIIPSPSISGLQIPTLLCLSSLIATYPSLCVRVLARRKCRNFPSINLHMPLTSRVSLRILHRHLLVLVV